MDTNLASSPQIEIDRDSNRAVSYLPRSETVTGQRPAKPGIWSAMATVTGLLGFAAAAGFAVACAIPDRGGGRAFRDSVDGYVSHAYWLAALLLLAGAAAVGAAAVGAVLLRRLAPSGGSGAMRAAGLANSIEAKDAEAGVLVAGLLDASSDCISVLGLDGRILCINAVACRNLGAETPERVIGQPWQRLWANAEADAVQAAIVAAREGWTGSFTGSTSEDSGAVRWWEVRVTPLAGSNGCPRRLLAIGRDVTAARISKSGRLLDVTQLILENGLDDAALAKLVFRKAAPYLEADLCLNYRFDASRDGMALVAQSGLAAETAATISAPKCQLNLFGNLDLADGADATAAQTDEVVACLIEQGAQAVICHPLLDTTQGIVGKFYFASRKRCKFNPDEVDFIQALAHFVSIAWQRHLSEDRVRDSEARFHAIADALPQVVWSARPDGYHDYFNQRWQDVTGTTLQQSEGDGWSNVIHPDDRVHAIELWRKAVVTGEPYEVERRLSMSDGTYCWMLARALPMRDKDGVVVRWFGTCTDIADIVAAREISDQSREKLEQVIADRTKDLRETESHLAHASRMKALGQLAGGIAHDFNNVLQAVRAGGSLIKGRPDDTKGVVRFSEMVLRAAERGSAITDRLLTFARRGELQSVAIDAAALVRGIRPILVHTLGPNVAIKINAGATLPRAFADKAGLETVLVNLATNARDAMAGHGKLTFSISEYILTHDKQFSHSFTLKAGRYVRISATDTGSGMDAATLGRVTEPFFTTKPFGQGTGLGLAMAYGFAEQSGGGLGIESEVGVGTTVSLWLPVAKPQSVAEAPDSAAPEPTIEQPTVRMMLVDDDQIVRTLLTEEMQRAGFAVQTCESGTEALAELDRNPAIDVLVSDMSMPGMDGVALIKEARRRQPKLPAILLTGLTVTAGDLPLTGPSCLLRKPVDGRVVAEKAAALMASVEAGD